jgi:hypoxanthine phosphoribosyltransferase
MINIDKLREIESQLTCLYTDDDVQAALDVLAQDITEKLKDANPIVLTVLTGSIIPVGHLVTRLAFPLQMDYLHVTRYQGKMHAGQLHWIAEPRLSLAGRTILIVEDVLDQGTTLAEVVKFCEAMGAEQVYTAVIVDKITQRAEGGLERADFTALSVDDLFLLGFGMDYEGYFRNLPGIYAVTENIDD